MATREEPNWIAVRVSREPTLRARASTATLPQRPSLRGSNLRRKLRGKVLRSRAPSPDATIGVSHDEAIGSEREPTFAFKFDKLDHALVAEAESYPSSSETEI